jgi:hypothetical protein
MVSLLCYCLIVYISICVAVSGWVIGFVESLESVKKIDSFVDL